jgi:hypothetical protein
MEKERLIQIALKQKCMENNVKQDNAIAKAFRVFFCNKGNIAPIAEKANKNFLRKKGSSVNIEGRIHYFAVGHAFKNIEAKEIFAYQLDKEQIRQEPSRFLSLQQNFFDENFCKQLEIVIENIRNVNGHYVHVFDFLELRMINKGKPEMEAENKVGNLVLFLKESFELAAINAFLNIKKISYAEFFKDVTSPQQFVAFLGENFYPNADFQKEEREAFTKLSKEKALERLLFIDVPEDFEWLLSEKSPIFTIKKGQYLSFYACLFLLSMFLYKGEAIYLISKIKGFKRSDGFEFQSKRNLFTFFSKKFSSQDVNSEEQHLVRFRDIVQYLNHYPTAWNQELEQHSKSNMSKLLQNKIVEMEIERLYPECLSFDSDKDRFTLYAKYQLFEKQYSKNLKQKYIEANFSTEEIDKFSDIITQSSELKGEMEKLKDSRIKKDDECIQKLEKYICELKEKQNPDVDKLKDRLAKNVFFLSYGRNQDRFMEFATRFLAENNYFGEEARFKMYEFYTTEEQEVYLEKKKKILTKKEYDKLKYHQGKLVHNITYAEHLKRYPEWDIPFVIENNSIQVIVTLKEGFEQTVIVQRNLMIYLLEDAFCAQAFNSAGKKLLSDYYSMYKKDFEEYKKILETDSSLTEVQKTQFAKLFPRRLLHHYLPANQNNVPKYTALQLILIDVKRQEERYGKRLEDAKKRDTEADFLRKNKGKQFKFRFLRKAWQLMYFKSVYLKNAREYGHHKRFNITKEEFNDFSRWMYAFDEVPAYKKNLAELFERKNFFTQVEFKALFENGQSLNCFYEKTKILYKKWLEVQEQAKDEKKYQLEGYEHIWDNSSLLFINVSHFIKYLEHENRLNRDPGGIIQYKALVNIPYLIEEYYYTDKLSKDEYKDCGKLYNKLKTAKLEDALLYEMAMHYLKIDKAVVLQAKNDIRGILSEDVIFKIIDNQNSHLYNLCIPFNKIDSFVELKGFQTDSDITGFKSTFFTKIKNYLPKVKDQNDVKSVYKSMKNHGILKYEDLNTLNNHLINHSINFTKVEMELERFYIVKDKIGLENNDYILLEKIDGLNDLYDKKISKIRNLAFHFGIPNDSYGTILSEIEHNFIQKEVSPNNPSCWDDLVGSEKQICNVFLRTFLHHKLFKRNPDKEKQYAEAQRGYFNEMIKSHK